MTALHKIVIFTLLEMFIQFLNFSCNHFAVANLTCSQKQSSALHVPHSFFDEIFTLCLLWDHFFSSYACACNMLWFTMNQKYFMEYTRVQGKLKVKFLEIHGIKKMIISFLWQINGWFTRHVKMWSLMSD